MLGPSYVSLTIWGASFQAQFQNLMASSKLINQPGGLTTSGLFVACDGIRNIR
jgi:hypothetical protein